MTKDQISHISARHAFQNLPIRSERRSTLNLGTVLPTNQPTKNTQSYSDPPPMCINPYPTAFPYGNGIVLHFYQQQESSTTKTVHRVINKGLKAYV